MSRLWLIVLAIVVLIFVGVVAVTRSGSGAAEGFVTVDADTATAQRQQLQFEGERRYNDLARLQSPGNTLDPATVQAALQTQVAVPTSKTASFLDFLTSNLSLGAADDGSGKQGSGVEQTGVIAQKIAFCESLGTDCNALNDPRAAECGICLNGGTDSTGKNHRGGLFISSDDQFRNGFGQQTPTIGTCPPANFVTDPTWCGVRSNELSCELASTLTDSDRCGMCFGGAAAGKNGLVYMGPKGQKFDAWLNVSHPGYHANAQNYGLLVTRADGTFLAGIPAATPGGNSLNPQMVLLPGLQEGDQLIITIYGPPIVWAGYLTNPANTRRVSLDIGIQAVTPAGAFEVAGDAYSSMVTNVMNGLSGWSGYQADLPKTVMWYQRQSQVVPPTTVKATYGSPANTVDATALVAPVLGTGAGLIVSQGVNYMNIGLSADPDSSVRKNLFLTQDTGNVLAIPDNSQLDLTKVQSTIVLNFTVPATLVDPPGPTDMADCPTGPIITTTTGLGLFGAHSCYKADGTANLTTGCLTELYQGAGGIPAGTLNPGGASGTAPLLAAVAAANKVSDPTTLTIDQITTFLGLQNDIMTYQADQNGTPVSFANYKTATQYLLGRTPGNPCDTPTAATGPHSPECLDYLWRTSGLLGAEPTLPNGDPTQLPYGFCTAAGSAHPSQSAANVAAANQQGGMSQVRAYYNAMYKAAMNPPAGATPDQINTALQACMGTNYQAPPPPPFDQCAPEVFQVVPSAGYNATQGDAAAVCSAVGATVATTAQIQEAYGFGAEWCSAGWVSDDTQNAYYPMQSLKPGCGNGAGVQKYIANWLPNRTPNTGNTLGNGDPTTALAGVNCYGVKPPQGTPDVLLFNQSISTWNAPFFPKVGMTISLVPTTAPTQSMRRDTSVEGLAGGTTPYYQLKPGPYAPPDTSFPMDASFKVVPANNGLGGYVSFESADPTYAGYFLRHMNFTIHVMSITPGDSNFNDDTSFLIVAPVVTSASSRGFSIQSSNFPDHYINYNYGNQAALATDQTTSAVWQIEPAQNGAKILSS